MSEKFLCGYILLLSILTAIAKWLISKGKVSSNE